MFSVIKTEVSGAVCVIEKFRSLHKNFNTLALVSAYTCVRVCVYTYDKWFYI